MKFRKHLNFGIACGLVIGLLTAWFQDSDGRVCRAESAPDATSTMGADSVPYERLPSAFQRLEEFWDPFPARIQHLTRSMDEYVMRCASTGRQEHVRLLVRDFLLSATEPRLKKWFIQYFYAAGHGFVLVDLGVLLWADAAPGGDESIQSTLFAIWSMYSRDLNGTELGQSLSDFLDYATLHGLVPPRYAELVVALKQRMGTLPR